MSVSPSGAFDVSAPLATPAATGAPANIDGDYSGGVTVWPTMILTENEIIPRFVANPTVASVRSGAWNNPSTWSTGHVPTDQDRVLIGQGTTVVYNSQSNARLDAVEVDGVLNFSAIMNTRMIVGTITVMPRGVLNIGTVAAPISSQVHAELIFADKPLDLVSDPAQYGTGLIGLGTVSIVGSGVSQTRTRLVSEVRAGDTSVLTSGDVSDWAPGDEILIPDSRQVPSSQAKAFVAGLQDYEDEELVIDHVVGNRVYLTSPVHFDHLGARNAAGQIELLPHVALVTRNAVIRSENPAGTRGYTLFTGRADVDIEYAIFKDLGRTDNYRDIDDTVRGILGSTVTHVGTNQSGRYAVYFNHLLGAENPTNSGYQFKFVGNTVDDPKKWGVAVNGSSYGLIRGNVVYDADGAAFVTCSGSEINNVFSGNIAISTYGNYVDGAEISAIEGDYARGGSGFWFRRGGNIVTSNVAADNVYSGFVIDSYDNLGELLAPAFRGADPALWQVVHMTLNPATLFSSNEAYGMTSYGLWLAFISGNNLLDNQPTTTVYGFKTWNVLNAGVWAYHTSHLTFDHLLILGDRAAQDRNDTGTRGIDLHGYENRDLVITNSRIEGVRTGIIAPSNDNSQAGVPDPTLIQDTVLKNYINIEVMPALDDRPSSGANLVVRNVSFTIVSSLPTGPAPAAAISSPANIWMNIQGFNQDHLDLTQDSTVLVYNYNKKLGDDFQVFYAEQAATYVVPKTDPALLSTKTDGLIGSPVAGLTNQQNWTRYGIAIGGALAPANASQSRSDINGLVAPIQDASRFTPRVVLITPWQDAQVTGGPPLRLRYNVNGLLPLGSAVFFSLDGGSPVTKFDQNALYFLAPGQHTIHGYIGNAFTAQPISGTIDATASFTVGSLFTPPTVKKLAQTAAASVEAANALATALATNNAAARPSAPTSQAVSLADSLPVAPQTVEASRSSAVASALWTQPEDLLGSQDDTPAEALLDASVVDQANRPS
jgi:hypothetical protein